MTHPTAHASSMIAAITSIAQAVIRPRRSSRIMALSSRTGAAPSSGSGARNRVIFAPVDNCFAVTQRDLWAAVENAGHACAAMVSHAIALTGLLAGYLVTFVLLGGAAG